MSNSSEVEAQAPAMAQPPSPEIEPPATETAAKEEEEKKPVRERKQKAPKEKKPKAPAHPPYFQMIKEAITTLNDKGGSSPYAIAKYMEEKHKAVLPSNFRKILGLQLKNSVAKGKLIKIKASYKLSEAGKMKEKPIATTKAARANAAKEPTKRRKAKSKAVSMIDNPPPTPTARRSKRSASVKPKQLKSIKSPVAKKATA